MKGAIKNENQNFFTSGDKLNYVVYNLKHIIYRRYGSK